MVMHSAEERIRANAADPPNCGQDRVSRRIELPWATVPQDPVRCSAQTIRLALLGSR